MFRFKKKEHVNMTKKIPLPKNRIINKPGYYVLTEDIYIEDNIGICITANSVTLDFQGYQLIANHPNHTENFGVHAANIKDFFVLNGKIEGFYHGLIASEVSHLIVHDMHFNNIKYIAINVTGDKASINNNLITNLDFNYPKNTIDYYLIGMRIGASGTSVTKNVIKNTNIPDVDTNSHVEYVALLIANDVKNTFITHNQFLNNPTDREKMYGIWCAGGSELTISSNYFTNHFYDIANLNATTNIKSNHTHNSKEFDEKSLEISVDRVKMIEESIFNKLKS